MKNDEIYNAAFFILDKFKWKKFQDITEDEHKKAYDTLQVVLNLFEKIDIERCNNEQINYGIYYRLPNVERELEQKCWHNACHELRDFLQLEFRFEKRMLTDTVYVLKKYLKGEAPAAEEIVKQKANIRQSQVHIAMDRKVSWKHCFYNKHMCRNRRFPAGTEHNSN